MPQATGYADAIGTFIDAWSDNFVEAYRNIVPILADTPFTEKDMAGGVYHVATRLTYEGGTTFGAPQVQPGTAGTPYVGPRAGFSPDAQVQGMQLHGRSQVTYEAIARSAASVNSSDTNKKKAVRSATKIVMDGLLQSLLKKTETLMIHGREGLGQGDTTVVNSNVVATMYEGVAGFNVDWNISPATWAEGIWLAFEGHTFDIYADAAGLPTGNKLNTVANTVLTGGANQNGLILTAVNPATPLAGGTATGRVLRFFHTSGTAGAPAAGVIGGFTTVLVAAQTQHLMFESSSPTVDFVGIGLMSQNAGTLFNINSQLYSMWRGNLISNVGNLRLSTLVRYMSRPINAGGAGLKYRAIVPTELFAQFANDESTLRRYPAVSSEAKNGFSKLEFYLPGQDASLEIMGHNLQKDGQVVVYCPEELIRVGAQDFDFVNRSGRSRQEAYVVEVQNSPASEMRAYGQFAPICATPRHMLRLTGVTF